MSNDNISITNKKSAWSILAICSLCCSFITFFMGVDKMINYREPDYSHNAYVGGDAYNYIINSNYATAFFVLTAMFVLAAIGLMILHYVSREKLSLPPQTIQKTVIEDIESNLPKI